MGARLNWILHFGLPPRFSKDVRVIQLDLSPEEMSNNVQTEVALVGDGKAVTGQLNDALEKRQWFCPSDTPWRAAIAEKIEANLAAVAPMIADNSTPMNYFRAYDDIVPRLPKNAIIIGEGANTMDIGRTQMPNFGARERLDWALPSRRPRFTRTGRSLLFRAIVRLVFPVWRSRPPPERACP